MTIKVNEIRIVKYDMIINIPLLEVNKSLSLEPSEAKQLHREIQEINDALTKALADMPSLPKQKPLKFPRGSGLQQVINYASTHNNYTIDDLSKETGLERTQLHTIMFRLKKEGSISILKIDGITRYYSRYQPPEPIAIAPDGKMAQALKEAQQK